MEKIILTVSEIMTMCQVSRATATRMAKACGTIPGRTKGQKIMVSRSKFERWLEGTK